MNPFRHIPFALAALALALLNAGCATTTGPATPPTFVGLHGRLSVSGNKIVDQTGRPLALHGMSLYCWTPVGKQFYNASAITHLVHDWHCTVIRIPVLPRDYQRNPAAEINRVRTVVDACRRANVRFSITVSASLEAVAAARSSPTGFLGIPRPLLCR